MYKPSPKHYSLNNITINNITLMLSMLWNLEMKVYGKKQVGYADIILFCKETHYLEFVELLELLPHGRQE